jgi:hypothetical protein
MIYVAECSECGETQDYISSLADRENTPVCCGVKTHQIIAAPMISAMMFTGWKGFHMPDGKQGGKGTWIESGNDYKAYLKKHNKMPESEGTPEAKLQKKNREAERARKRRKDVEKIVLDRVS